MGSALSDQPIFQTGVSQWDVGSAEGNWDKELGAEKKEQNFCWGWLKCSFSTTLVICMLYGVYEHSSTHKVSEWINTHALVGHNQKGLEPSATMPFRSLGLRCPCIFTLATGCCSNLTHFSNLNQLVFSKILVSSWVQGEPPTSQLEGCSIFISREIRRCLQAALFSFSVLAGKSWRR